MKRDSDQFTLIPKLVVGRKTKEVFQLLKLLMILLVPLVILGTIQVVLCKKQNPATTILECFRMKGVR